MSYVNLTAKPEMKISEAKYRVMIDAIPTMAWCSLPDGSVEFFNQRWHDYMVFPLKKRAAGAGKPSFIPMTSTPLNSGKVLVTGSTGSGGYLVAKPLLIESSVGPLTP